MNGRQGLLYVKEFVLNRRAPDDYLYLLIDPLAEGCKSDFPLHPSQLRAHLPEEALTAVPRPDLPHAPKAWPLLVTLAVPGGTISADYDPWNTEPQLLALSAFLAVEDAGYTKRYICGWLSSQAEPQTIAEQLAARCLLPSTQGTERFAPMYEPLRLELLAAELQSGLGDWLGPINQWLCPTSSGSFTLLKGTRSDEPFVMPATVANTQAQVPEVSTLLSAWRSALRQELGYAPLRWQGDTVLPSQAGATALTQIRQAHALGLSAGNDITLLALHRLLIHPRLPEHPKVRADIGRAARGEASLGSIFNTYTDTAWKRVVDALMEDTRQ